MTHSYLSNSGVNYAFLFLQGYEEVDIYYFPKIFSSFKFLELVLISSAVYAYFH